MKSSSLKVKNSEKLRKMLFTMRRKQNVNNKLQTFVILGT